MSPSCHWTDHSGGYWQLCTELNDASLALMTMMILYAVQLIGNGLKHISEVDLRQARLVLRWVTILGYTALVFNQATEANSAWSSLHG